VDVLGTLRRLWRPKMTMQPQTGHEADQAFGSAQRAEQTWQSQTHRYQRRRGEQQSEQRLYYAHSG
jgi:hypothetical protein